MATVTVSRALSAGTHPTRQGNTELPYLIEYVVDFAAAVATKGSALVATDVLQAMYVPSESIILTAGAEVIVPADSTTLTVDLGVGANGFVSGFNAKSAAGTYTTRANTAEAQRAPVTTIDVTLNTLTGTLTSGKLRVFAVVIDVQDRKTPGLAKIGS